MWSNLSHCEDLPQHGVVLVPPASPEYDPLLADIQRRLDQPISGSPPLPESMRPRIPAQDRETSMILLNRNAHGIAAIQQVWSIEDVNGRKSGGVVGGGSNPSVLLPFGLPEKLLRLYGYWHVILPGSKRYLNSNGGMVGDNRRAPAWTGRGLDWRDREWSRRQRPLTRAVEERHAHLGWRFHHRWRIRRSEPEWTLGAGRLRGRSAPGGSEDRPNQRGKRQSAQESATRYVVFVWHTAILSSTDRAEIL